LKNEKGSEEFTLSVAGIGISFLFDQSLTELEVNNINSEFITGNRAEIKLRVHHGSLPERNIEEKIFDSGSTWSLFRSQGKFILQDCSFEPDSILEKLVVLESDFKSGEIYAKNDSSNLNFFLDSFGYPLHQVLMIILLSRGQGAMFHACGIDDRGSGYLFLGQSTHGKSTMAKLWSQSQATVLNDDRIIVREKDGVLWMYGTPWSGDFKEVSSKGLPIQKIFFLRRGKSNSVVRKESGEAVSMLLTRAFPPFWDKEGMEYTVGLCHLMANKLPGYELTFIPDKKIIDFVRAL
jgi:hypothetical protein